MPLHQIRTVNRTFYVILACLLAGYVIAIALASSDSLVGDEVRYYTNAKSFAEGNYKIAHQPNYDSGPAYSFFMQPFVEAGAPLWMPRMFNAFFLAGALWFFFQTARWVVPSRWAFGATLVMGLNPVALSILPQATPEILTMMLSCAFVWSLAHVFQHTRLHWRWILLTAVLLFALTMFRVVFGYVATAGVFAVVAFCVIRNRRDRMWHALAPLGTALVLCAPYLSYTHYFSGQFPKWSMNNGEMFYWMTSPNEGEWGNRILPLELAKHPELVEAHSEILSTISTLPEDAHAGARKAHALKNLKAHPEGYVRNLTANVSRALFGFPHSYENEKLSTVFYVIPGMALVIFGALALYPTRKVWYQIPTFIKVYGVVAIGCVGFSLLLPVEPRHMLPAVPAAVLWLAFIYGRIIKVNLVQTWQLEDGPVSHSCKEWLDKAA